MGYRSDVGIAIGFANDADVDSFLVSYSLKEPEFWASMVAGNWYRCDNNVLTTKYESVKWNTSYPEVSALYKMLNFATDNYVSAWRLVRIGEEDDDNEAHSDTYLDDESATIGVITSILDRLYDYVDFHRMVDVATSDELI